MLRLFKGQRRHVIGQDIWDAEMRCGLVVAGVVVVTVIKGGGPAGGRLAAQERGDRAALHGRRNGQSSQVEERGREINIGHELRGQTAAWMPGPHASSGTRRPGS